MKTNADRFEEYQRLVYSEDPRDRWMSYKILSGLIVATMTDYGELSGVLESIEELDGIGTVLESLSEKNEAIMLTEESVDDGFSFGLDKEELKAGVSAYFESNCCYPSIKELKDKILTAFREAEPKLKDRMKAEAFLLENLDDVKGRM